MKGGQSHKESLISNWNDSFSSFELHRCLLFEEDNLEVLLLNKNVGVQINVGQVNMFTFTQGTTNVINVWSFMF